MTSNLNYLYILRGIHFVLPDKYSTYAMHLKSQLTAHIYDFSSWHVALFWLNYWYMATLLLVHRKQYTVCYLNYYLMNRYIKTWLTVYFLCKMMCDLSATVQPPLRAFQWYLATLLVWFFKLITYKSFQCSIYSFD